MKEQRDDDSMSDIYTDSGSLFQGRNRLDGFRQSQNNEPRGDDSVSDVYTTDGNNSLYLPVGAEEEDSFQARVREEERKIIAEYSLDMSQSQGSHNNDVPQVVASPQGLGRDLLWNGSSVGTNDSRSIFANSYDGIMKRLRLFTPKAAKTNQTEPRPSPQRTKETESPSAIGGYEPSFDEGFAELEREVSMPPRTIVFNTPNRRKGLVSRIRKLRTDRLIAILAAVLFIAVAVALGSWAVSRYSGRNSDSAQEASETAASPPTVGSPPTVAATPPTASPSAIPVPINEDTSENSESTPDPQLTDDVTVSPTSRPTDSPTSSPTGAPSALPSAIPTKVPSSIPSQSPTLEPSPVPSAFPTTRATTTAPTALPSMNPSIGRPREECGDDNDSSYASSDIFVFINQDIGYESCLWLSDPNRASTRRRVCQEGFEAYEFCRKACGNCPPTNETTTSPTDSPTTSPTGSPTTAPKAEIVAADYLKSIILQVSPSSATALDNSQSPQAKALAWLETTDFRNTQESQIRQQWVLAGFALASKRDGWTVNNWLDNDSNECSWFGVECDSQNRVTEIILRQNNLEGKLFPELVLLADSLRVLDVGRNKLTGEFPPEYGNLRNLRWLAIDRNGMTGQLPRQIGDLSNLSILQVEFNHLSGELPTQLGDLDLREFKFFSNNFVGTIPEEICRMRRLETLEGDCREVECPCCTRCWFQCGGWTGIACP